MIKFRYYIIGLILIILGFLTFVFIAVLNEYDWMNFTYHIIVVLLGFLLISLGIISMIMFLRSEKGEKREKDRDWIGEKTEMSYYAPDKKGKDKVK